MKATIYGLILFISSWLYMSCQSKGPASQNPSPMVEHIRPHERISEETLPGIRFQIKDILPDQVDVFIPGKSDGNDSSVLFIHFFGGTYVAEYAVSRQSHSSVLATVNLGSGSSKNEKPFLDSNAFDHLLAAIYAKASENNILLRQKVFLSAFSAGYGAIRAIIKEKDNWKRIEGILLLDGLHTGYLPDGMPIAEGGKLELPPLQDFLEFARLAVKGEKRFIFNHSEVFPGTFASTTECADYLIDELGMKRSPVLKSGPLGMQQVAETIKGGLMINAFAGNTAPDHVDHYHAMYYFLGMLADLK